MTEDTKKEPPCQSTKKRPRDDETPCKDDGNSNIKPNGNDNGNNDCHEEKNISTSTKAEVGNSSTADGADDRTKDANKVKTGDDKDGPVAKKARHDNGKEDGVSKPFEGESKVKTSNDTDADADAVKEGKEEQPKSVFGSSVPFSGFTGLKSQSSIASASATSDSVDTTKSIFGSTSSASTGFGFSSGNASNTGSTASISGSIFGKSITAPSTGFGSSTSIFGSKKETTGGNNGSTSTSIFGSFAPSSSSLSKKEEGTQAQPKTALPQPTKPISNGEENEETTFTMRAKLYKLQKTNDSLPPTSSVDIASNEEKKETGIKCATKVGNDAATATSNNGSENDPKSETATETTVALKMEWKEVGIGPLKILISNSDKNTARIVQRRESTPGGPGTKLILNLMLREECIVEKRGDKFVKLAAFEVIEGENDSAKNDEKNSNEGTGDKAEKKMILETVQYLFKVKTVADADSLLSTLKQFCK